LLDRTKPIAGCSASGRIIIILPHNCIKQLSRGENKPTVGHAHCLVHILFLLRLAVYRTYNTNVSIFRNLSRYKGGTLLTKFVLQNFPYKYQRVLNCDNEGANAVFRALHFCYRDLQHASTLINSGGKKYSSLPGSSASLLFCIQLQSQHTLQPTLNYMYSKN
jgi:hypothetical protein